MRVALKKLPGVESAEVSLDTASADIRLKPDNRITLAELRQILKKSGYPTRDAQVEARGKVVDRGGAQVFDLLNGSSLDLDGKSIALTASPQAVDVTGVSRVDGKVGDRLTVLTAR